MFLFLEELTLHEDRNDSRLLIAESPGSNMMSCRHSDTNYLLTECFHVYIKLLTGAALSIWFYSH